MKRFVYRGIQSFNINGKRKYFTTWETGVQTARCMAPYAADIDLLRFACRQSNGGQGQEEGACRKKSSEGSQKRMNESHTVL
jgi:hypothetical protein